MSQTSIRLVKTPEVEKVISFLRNKYTLLSEPEIIKLALSEKYQREAQDEVAKQERAIKAWEHLKIEGKKIGDKMMRDRGLDPDKVTEEEFYLCS